MLCAIVAVTAPVAAATQVAGPIGSPPDPVASAQVVSAAGAPLDEEELLRRISALLPVLGEARSAAAAAERRRALEAEAEPRPPTEVVRVGPLSIVVPPDQAELAATLFAQVWSESFEGVTGSPALAAHAFVFQWAWRRPEPLRIDPAESGHAALQRVELTRAWARTRGAAESRIREAIWTVLRRDLPERSRLDAWIGPASYPEGQRVARRLIGTSSEANTACLEGETEACRRALGLAGAERSVPLDAPAMVLLEAVRRGGEGAWPRLLERSDAEPLDALAHAARTDDEAVLAVWRERVLAERPEVHAGLAGQAARALLWVLALGALAMKSTRWRLA